MSSNERKRHLYLVHSQKVKNTDSSCGTSMPAESRVDEGIQLELFESDKPDVMIFTQPLNLDFDDIERLMDDGHITRIFDLREVPYMTFGNETRERFLKALHERQIEYFNLAKLGLLFGISIQQADDLIEYVSSFGSEHVPNELKRRIEHGPTMVFSDKDPTKDVLVLKFQHGLERANIGYSPYYTREQG